MKKRTRPSSTKSFAVAKRHAGGRCGELTATFLRAFYDGPHPYVAGWRGSRRRIAIAAGRGR